MIPGVKKRVFNFHDLMMYVAIARKHLRLITLLLCLSLLACMTYYIFAMPVYYARSLVKIQYTVLPLDSEKMFHDSNVNYVAQQLMSPHIIERTAHALGVGGDYRDIERHYIKKFTVRLNSERNFELEVWPFSYQLAKVWNEQAVKEF